MVEVLQVARTRIRQLISTNLGRGCPYLAIYSLGVDSREIPLSLVPADQSVPASLEVRQRPGGPLHHDVLLDAQPNQLLDELVPLDNVAVAVEDVLLCALNGLLVNETIKLEPRLKFHLILHELRGGCRGSRL